MTAPRSTWEGGSPGGAQEGSPQASRRRTEHVVLLSIDGLRPQLYRDERWPAPVLQELAQEGAIVLAARTVFPALTYPAHAMLVTGCLPARHGVVHNEPFEPGGGDGRWLWEARTFRVPTLWDAVRAAGGTTAAVSWPVTVGAAIDWNVPDVWDPRNTGSIEPIRAATTPPALFAELEQEATGRLSEHTFSLDHLGREDAVGAMAAYLFARHRPTLLLVHVIGLDHVRHRLGRDNPRARRAVAAADRALARIVEAVERLSLRDRTTFVVVGDHGAVDLHTALCPNVWLRDARGARTDTRAWPTSFLASGGSAFLRPHAGAPRDPATIASDVRETLSALPGALRALFRVVERAELDALGADPEALLALAAVAGVAFLSTHEGLAVRAIHGAGHGYHPEVPDMTTGFVAAGAGVRAGTVVPLLPLENVAPFVAALLGITLPACDGMLFPGLITEE